VIGILNLHDNEQLNRWSKPGEASNDNEQASARRIDVAAINRFVKFSNKNNEAASQGRLSTAS